MIPVKIKLSKEETIKLWLPTSWKEITVQQYCRLEADGWAGNDILYILSVLTDVDLAKLDNMKHHRAFDVLVDHLAFITEEPPDFEKMAINNIYTLDGKQLEVPRDLELETLGQKILVSNLTHNDSLASSIPEAMAIYFQPLFDKGDFNRRRIPAIVAKINKTPIIDAYPIVAFFFRSLRELKVSGLPF